MIAIKAASGSYLKKTDRPSGSYGPETVTYVAESDELLTVEVRAFIPDASDGRYELRYSSISPPSSTDISRAEAENLTSRAEELRGTSSRDNRLEAIREFKRALGIWEGLGDRFEQAVVLYGIGFTHYNLSEHQEAAVCYLKALKIQTEIAFGFGIAVNHSALGAVQYAMADFALSEYNYHRAIAIYSRIAYTRGLGIAYHGLGTAQMLSGNFKEARRSLEMSMMFRKRANDRSGELLTSLTLVGLHLQMGKSAEAELELLRAEKDIGPERAAGNPQFLYHEGRVRSALRRFDGAILDLTEALRLFRRDGNRLREAQTLFELSRAKLEVGQPEASLADIENAVSVIEELRRSTLNYRLRVGFTATVRPFFEHHVRVLMTLHRQDRSKGHDTAAFEVAERGRARGLLDRLERRSLIQKMLVDPEVLERENTLRDRLTDLIQESGAQPSEEKVAYFQNVSAEYAEVEAAIDRGLDIPETGQIATVSVNELQRLLGADSAFLSYEVTSDETLVWFISKSRVISRPLGASNLARTLTSEAMKCFSSRPADRRRSLCRTESEALGRFLLGPVSAELTDKRLIIQKSEAVEGVPFSALLNPSTGRYLVQSNEILELPSASVLSLLRSAPIRPSQGIAVFADPVYSPADRRIGTPIPSEAAGTDEALPRLFATRFEAERIAALFPGDEASVNMDFEADKEAFFAIQKKPYRFLHFATHAVIDEKRPETSAVVLSIFDGDGRPRPGKMRPTDIQRLDLTAELVVLSGCKTGIGRQIPAEGVASVAQSFFSVGAKKVMFSRWEVDDKITAETMVRFYRNMISEKQSPASALRNTQISLLSDARWGHPYYWAAFTMQGVH